MSVLTSVILPFPYCHNNQKIKNNIFGHNDKNSLTGKFTGYEVSKGKNGKMEVELSVTSFSSAKDEWVLQFWGDKESMHVIESHL